MTATRLLGAVGDIKDEYVQEADAMPVRVKKFAWVKWVAVAACVVVAILIAVPLLWNPATKGDESPGGPSGKLISSDSFLGGANARMPYERDYLYNSYEELAADYADPVFEALANSSIAQQHKVTFGLVCSAKPQNNTNGLDEIVWGDEYLAEARVAIDAPSSNFYGEDVPVGIVRYVNFETVASQSEYDYGDAERLGTRTDYIVDGIEVQKYEWFHYMDVLTEEITGKAFPAEYPQTSYQERVSINGEWYYVYSADEGLADAVASTLARIAAGLAS